MTYYGEWKVNLSANILLLFEFSVPLKASKFITNITSGFPLQLLWFELPIGYAIPLALS